MIARMVRFTGKRLWSMPALGWVIAVTMASPGCARQPGGIGCSMCRPPATVKPPTIVTTGKFVAAAAMTTPRAGHVATRLNDGRVLIAGGWTPSGQQRSAEVYNPATGNFAATGSMSSAHQSLAAVLLAGGNVLFVGGSSAEIYDVRDGRFEPAGGTIDELDSPMAVLLKDGRVLTCAADTSCELYFPKSKTFRETSHTHGNGPYNPILLDDGTVLISDVACLELFDPETETFRVIASPHCALPLSIRLDEGRIFMGSEFFDPRDDAFRDAAGFLNAGGSVTPLQSGKLLVAGGSECRSYPSIQGGPSRGVGISPAHVGCSPVPIAKAWLYDPQTQTQVEIEDMNVRRSGHTATRLNDGSVLIAGGRSADLIESSAEIYVP